MGKLLVALAPANCLTAGFCTRGPGPRISHMPFIWEKSPIWAFLFNFWPYPAVQGLFQALNSRITPGSAESLYGYGVLGIEPGMLLFRLYYFSGTQTYSESVTLSAFQESQAPQNPWKAGEQ